MQHLLTLIDFILHLNVHLGQWVNEYGNWVYAFLFMIVFCETGLVITPFLPGDSLLFAAGAVFASSHLNVHTLVITLIAAAICGDNCNYWIGRWVGPKVFHNQTRWLRREYLERTHQFYERYGGKTLIIARFVPIIRTFAPFVAGVGNMTYKRFVFFSIAAALIWVCSLVYLSYWFGNLPWVQRFFPIVILAIIFISILPPLIEFILAYRRGKT